MKKIIFLSLFLLLGVFSFAGAEEKVEMYFFWGDGCPHCTAAKPFIEELKNEYPNLNIKSYEVYNNESNYNLWQSLAKAYNAQDELRGVPSFFIGENAFAGYHESMNDDFRMMVEDCLGTNCASPIEKLKQMDSNPQTVKNKTGEVSQTEGDDSNSTFLFLFIVFAAVAGGYYFLSKKNK
ncbi:thioredoxin family protein [Candidatus Falkowbacteria bacterium]|jgi:thiol-disulfide isomerase/thioredoxin|nr:thioredoxin family protein [Candidatus Falkowbacteria bacterium]MBT4433073.1 thioredoxin family protein [Candidatus Falkowbacteria bacterium]